MKILFVKLSSMGDLVHALPALTDAMRVRPDIRFTWAVEASFADVPTWHPAVTEIIVCDHRNWRKRPWHTLRSGALRHFFKRLRRERYDLVIDGQSNFKSALVTRCAKGLRCGFDRRSAREPFVGYAYQKKYAVSKNSHATQRLRELVAQAVGYPCPQTPLDYGIDRSRFAEPEVALPERYLLFVTHAGRINRLWPDERWRQLIAMAAAYGYPVVLTSGNARELAHAEALAAAQANVVVLPLLPLSAMASVIAGATAAVCVDTGLGHLAAAIGVPSVSLYGATRPEKSGTAGVNAYHVRADFPCSPCESLQCRFKPDDRSYLGCYRAISPQRVWQALQPLLPED